MAAGVEPPFTTTTPPGVTPIHAEFSLVADDRGNPLVNIAWTTTEDRSLAGRHSLFVQPIDFMGDHIAVDGNYPKYISKCSIARGQRKKLSFIGSQRDSGMIRARATTARSGWFYPFDPLPACIPRSDRPFQRADRVIFVSYIFFNYQLFMVIRGGIFTRRIFFSSGGNYIFVIVWRWDGDEEERIVDRRRMCVSL